MAKNVRAWMPGRWPFRPQPLTGEMLSSYLIRVTHGLGIKPVTFLQAVWGTDVFLRARDLDNYAPPEVIARITEGTGITLDAILQMTFEGLQGRLHNSHIPMARKNWILPISTASSQRRRPGLQFCPHCLLNDPKPYFRLNWRLAFVTCCTTHGTMLRDRCPRCDALISPNKSPSFRHCFRCVADLSADLHLVPTAHTSLVAFQRDLEVALEEGWGTFAGRPIYSQLLFGIVRHIAALLVNGRYAEAFREAVVALHGGDASPVQKIGSRHPIEYLVTADRARIFELVQGVLADLPNSLVDVCRTAGMSRSHVMRDMPYVPFVFDEILKTYLNRSNYYASESEVIAAAAWLRRTHGFASYSDLKAHCGESRAAIYKHMDYKRPPALPSQWRLAAKASEPAQRAQPSRGQ